LIALGLVGWRIYKVWQDGPWSLPQYTKAAAPVPAEAQTEVTVAQPINPETIISRNLFDPERGAGTTREVEFNSGAFQRIRNMVLVGTVVLGNDRSAILQDGASPAGAPTVSGQLSAPMRVKLGDSVEGFSLTEITDRRVVFTKGRAKVEVLLDYFRKPDPVPARGPMPSQVRTPRSTVPRVIPNLPRRGTPPAQPNPNPNSNS